MTAKLLVKLPETIRRTIENCRKEYSTAKEHDNHYDRRVVLGRNAGYVLGLRDAGIITERERQLLFIYMTI